MSARKIEFAEGEYYHVYNRGVDRRDIFSDKVDVERFMQSMKEFNVEDPIGSIYENSFRESELGSEASKSALRKRSIEPLVEFVAYCLNPNHFHFVLRQIAERGIERYMQRLGTGYTKYFNHRHKRTGALFQGVFKASHIGTNEYLLHVATYVNLNDRVHQLGSEASKLMRSSWKEYTEKTGANFCVKDIVLKQFRTLDAYKKFAGEALRIMQDRKKSEKDLRDALFE